MHVLKLTRNPEDGGNDTNSIYIDAADFSSVEPSTDPAGVTIFHTKYGIAHFVIETPLEVLAMVNKAQAIALLLVENVQGTLFANPLPTA